MALPRINSNESYLNPYHDSDDEYSPGSAYRQSLFSPSPSSSDEAASPTQAGCCGPKLFSKWKSKKAPEEPSKAVARKP